MDNGVLLTNIGAGILLAAFGCAVWMAILMFFRAVIPGRRDRTRVPGWVWLVAPILAWVQFGRMSVENGEGEWAVATDAGLLAFVIIVVTLVVRSAMRNRRISPRTDDDADEPGQTPLVAGSEGRRARRGPRRSSRQECEVEEMAWWRRSKKPGTVSVSVLDPTAAKGRPFQRPGLVVGERQLPAITTPSFTDRAAEQARATYPAGTGPVGTVITHNTVAEDGSAVYVGLGGRAAVVIRLTPNLRADLHDLGEAIRDSGASLYLDSHPGFLRASLSLPLMDFEIDTGMLLGLGDVQEFLRAAYTTETIELHISHTTDDRLLPLTCAAPGIRAVLDAGFDLITRPAPADLATSLAAVNTSLNPLALVPLRVAGRAELAIAFDVEI